MLKLKIYKANFAPGHMNEVHVLFAGLYKKNEFFCTNLCKNYVVKAIYVHFSFHLQNLHTNAIVMVF